MEDYVVVDQLDVAPHERYRHEVFFRELRQKVKGLDLGVGKPKNIIKFLTLLDESTGVLTRQFAVAHAEDRYTESAISPSVRSVSGRRR